MKRPTAIALSLFVIFAGAASAWARCEQSVFQANSAASAHGHDHSESNHKHEHNAVIHCPTLNVFLLSAPFSPSKNDRIERLTLVDIVQCPDQFSVRQLYRSLHGPPGYSRFSHIPPYLVLSVLRI
jgi:hypothetical protein